MDPSKQTRLIRQWIYINHYIMEQCLTDPYKSPQYRAMFNGSIKTNTIKKELYLIRQWIHINHSSMEQCLKEK